jgi:hypothetical protein
MHPRLALVTEEISYHKGSQELDLASAPQMDEPSPTLDQHEHH